jgi:hypothetical protein
VKEKENYSVVKSHDKLASPWLAPGLGFSPAKLAPHP